MQLRNALISCILTNTLVISQGIFLSSWDEARAQSNRPYIVLVNGYQNCCAWGITDRFPSLNAEIRAVPYSNFSDGGSSGNASDDSDFLRDGADFLNKLDPNRPLILIGHSFGGDSVLNLLPRINRRIQFVAVVDPVRTGGFRATLKNLSVPSNVDYFYNRWQENLPFPNDFKTNGSIPCSARTCDQDSQNIARNADFSPRTTECRWDEVTCPGFVAPIPLVRKGRKGTKQVRVSHQDLPRDAFLQKDLGEKIQKQLSNIATVPISTRKVFIKSAHGNFFLNHTIRDKSISLADQPYNPSTGAYDGELWEIVDAGGGRVFIKSAHGNFFLNHTIRDKSISLADQPYNPSTGAYDGELWQIVDR
jgi:pimeloyl-ACP methyl ester carboxylesterase